MESWEIFKNYGGEGLLLWLFLLGELYLLCREKNKTTKIFLVYFPLTILFLFFFPPFRMLYVKLIDDGGTYYRILWMLPVTVCIAYSGCHFLFSLEKRVRQMIQKRNEKSVAAKGVRAILFSLFALVVVICGSYVYTGPYMSKAENAYHIPQTVIEICKLIEPEEGERPVYATFPAALVYYVRQYNTNICLTYGRDSVEPSWGYYNAFHEAMEKTEVICTDELLELTRGYGDRSSRYIIMDSRRQADVPLDEQGLVLLGIVDGYHVYEDPVVVEMLKEIYGEE